MKAVGKASQIARRLHLRDRSACPHPNPPAATVQTVRAVAGVREATGLVGADGARVIGADGKVLTSMGPPRRLH